MSFYLKYRKLTFFQTRFRLDDIGVAYENQPS